MNLLKDIRQDVLQHFQFLKEHSFPPFEEKQLSYEYHFITRNEFVEINIWFELTYNTPIWLQLQPGGYVEHVLDKEDTLLILQQQKRLLYKTVWENYLQCFRKKYLVEIAQLYQEGGRQLNAGILEAYSKIIKANPQWLLGAVTDIQQANEFFRKRHQPELEYNYVAELTIKGMVVELAADNVSSLKQQIKAALKDLDPGNKMDRFIAKDRTGNTFEITLPDN